MKNKFEFTPPELTLEDKERIDKLMEKRESLSEEFLKSEAVNNSPIIHKSVYMIKNGIDIYNVFEEMAETFYRQNKEQFEIIKKLVENFGESKFK